MKTSEEMVASLLRRRDAYYREKKRRSRIAACSAAGCLAVGIGVFSVFTGGGRTPNVSPGDTGVQESLPLQTGETVIRGGISAIILSQSRIMPMVWSLLATHHRGMGNVIIPSACAGRWRTTPMIR